MKSKTWDFGDLPAEITFSRNGTKLTGFPALVDDGESVAIRLSMPRGSAKCDAPRRCALLRLALKEQIKQLEKGPGISNQLALHMRAR